MNTGKALLGVMAGIAAGAVLGMLFAPEKGSNTRKNISKKGDDLANALNDKVDAKFNELMNSFTGKMKKSSKAESAASTGIVD
jgi:gas vesicle protein